DEPFRAPQPRPPAAGPLRPPHLRQSPRCTRAPGHPPYPYPRRAGGALGRPREGGVRAASDQTHKLVDDEVRRDECYAEAMSLLREHRAKLDALVESLLVKETLDENEAYAAAGIPSPAAVPQPV